MINSFYLHYELGIILVLIDFKIENLNLGIKILLGMIPPTQHLSEKRLSGNLNQLVMKY